MPFALRLREIARQAGWTEQHLCREFKNVLGVTIKQFHLNYRMIHAAYLLRDPNRRISEIAELVGFPDLYSFSKMFKRCMTVSPKAYRERLLNPVASS